MKKTDETELIVLPEINLAVSVDEIKAFVVENADLVTLDPTAGIKNDTYLEYRKRHIKAVTFRTGIEAKRKELNAPALKYSKQINEIAKEYTALLTDTETRLFKERYRVEQYEKEKEQKRIDIERKRVETLGAEITRLREIPLTIMGKSEEAIDKIYDSIPIPTIEIYQERHNEAITIYKDSMEKLENQILTMRKSEQADIIIAEADAKHQEEKKALEDKANKEREEFEAEKAEFEAEKKARQATIDAEDEARAKVKAEEEAEAYEKEQAEQAKAFKERQEEEERTKRVVAEAEFKVFEKEATEALYNIVEENINETRHTVAEAILEAIISEQIPHVKLVV